MVSDVGIRLLVVVTVGMMLRTTTTITMNYYQASVLTTLFSACIPTWVTKTLLLSMNLLCSTNGSLSRLAKLSSIVKT